jgi:hypothetical protein
VAIIGAGASGIVTAKTLLAAKIPVTVYEAGSQVGGLWVYENDNGSAIAYKNLYILTPKRYTQWRDFPMDADTPEYARHSDMARYFVDYVDHFQLRPHIRFNERVTKVVPEGRQWRVGSAVGDELYDAVIVATGHFHTPRVPRTLDGFTGETMHSAQYRDVSQVLDRRVLVIGLGNSACDVAADVSWGAQKTVISARTPVFSGPRWFFGHSVLDVMHYFQGPHVPRAWKGKVGRALVRLYWGDMTRWGVRRPEKATHGVFHEFLLPILKSGRLTIRPDVVGIEGRQVTFADGHSESFDVIISATGYRLAFPFLDQIVELNEDSSDVDDLYLHVVAIRQPGLFFVGLANNNGLANTPTFERQAEFIADVLTGDLVLPDAETMAAAVRERRARRDAMFLNSPRHALEEPQPDYLIDLIAQPRTQSRRPMTSVSQEAPHRCWLCGRDVSTSQLRTWHATDWGRLQRWPDRYTKPVRLCRDCVRDVRRSRRRAAAAAATLLAGLSLSGAGLGATVRRLSNHFR